MFALETINRKTVTFVSITTLSVIRTRDISIEISIGFIKCIAIKAQLYQIYSSMIIPFQMHAVYATSFFPFDVLILPSFGMSYCVTCI